MGIARGRIPWAPRIAPEACIGCGECLATCPNDVFVLNNAKNIVEVADPDSCVPFCDKCADFCRQHAIKFPDKEQIKELVRRLMEELSDETPG